MMTNEINVCKGYNGFRDGEINLIYGKNNNRLCLNCQERHYQDKAVISYFWQAEKFPNNYLLL